MGCLQESFYSRSKASSQSSELKSHLSYSAKAYEPFVTLVNNSKGG